MMQKKSRPFIVVKELRKNHHFMKKFHARKMNVIRENRLNVLKVVFIVHDENRVSKFVTI